MRRVLFFALSGIAVLLSGCSSDSPSPKPSTVTAVIDGANVVFNTVHVDKEPFPDEGYTDLVVTASVDNDPELILTFIVEEEAIGTEASWYFTYFLNETAFPKLPGFETYVAENTGYHIKGTFSGQVQADVEPFEVADIQNGTFDIYY